MALDSVSFVDRQLLNWLAERGDGSCLVVNEPPGMARL